VISTLCLFLLGNEVAVPPVVFLFLTGFLLIAAGAFWSIRNDLIRDVDDSAIEGVQPEVTCAPPGPRAFPKDLTLRVSLTLEQKRELLDCYHRQYTEQHVWPDIKLEAFACDVQNWRPGRVITVYFAQRRIVREFANQNSLPWLAEQLVRESRSFDESEEPQERKEARSVINATR
jgi:hypothetical protein